MSYAFDPSVPDHPEQVAALALQAHEAFNTDSTIPIQCLSKHPTSTGHVQRSEADQWRCPGHAVLCFADLASLDPSHTSAKASELWLFVRDELLRGQAWVRGDAEIRRHMRMLADIAAALGHQPPVRSYAEIPNIGDFVVIASVPHLLMPGHLTHVLGTLGRVKPQPTIISPEPEPWEGRLELMMPAKL